MQWSKIPFRETCELRYFENMVGYSKDRPFHGMLHIQLNLRSIR